MDASTTPTLNPPQKEGGGGPQVYLETFGCQMNVLDSQLVVGQLRGLGYGFTDDWKSADVVLYNTCSVREVAENKVWSTHRQGGQAQGGCGAEHGPGRDWLYG